MKKMIATLAIAGIGAALATGAQAQTIPSFSGTGSGAPGYAVTLAETTTQVGALYQYTYTVTNFVPDGGTVNSVIFSGISGFAGGQNATGFGNFSSSAYGTPTTIAFTNGTLAANSTFSFLDTLAPGKTTIGVVGSDSAGGVNTGGLVLGPGAATVPEAGSFALLGLGLLPLAFVARRRISRNA